MKMTIKEQKYLLMAKKSAGKVRTEPIGWYSHNEASKGE
jgi:hypothetical protein